MILAPAFHHVNKYADVSLTKTHSCLTFRFAMDPVRLDVLHTISTRKKMVWMWYYGFPVRSIAQVTGASTTTVYRWIRRWQEEGHVTTRLRQARATVTALQNKRLE